MNQNLQATKQGPMEIIHHYWRFILKWKWTAFLFFFLVVAGATLFALLATPSFTADGSIWIDDDPKILPFDQTQTLGAGNNMQSHAYLLQSRALASETIKKLKLYENPEFVEQIVEEGPVENSNLIEENLLKSFTQSISVSPVQGTRLVNVKFSHRNPRIAAEILNALFAGYIDMIIRKRSVSSEQAMEVLRIPVASLRTEIEEREKQLNDFGLKNDILPLTTSEAPTITRLAEFNTALTAATIDKINKLNYYNQVKSAPLGEIPDAPAGSLIQNLRTQYSNLSREYATKLTNIRPEYPEMKRLKSELDAATAALQSETQNIIRVAYKDYQAALQKEQSLQRELDILKNEAYKTNSNSINYNNLRIELESKKTLLESLTKRLSETDVSSGLKGLEAINVWIVNKAEPPLTPTFPNKRKIVLIGLLIGLAGGVGLAFGLEYLNQTVKTSRDVTISTALPTLGGIPSFETETKQKGPRFEFKKIVAIISGGSKIKESKIKSPRPAKNLGLELKKSSNIDVSDKEPQKYSIELITSRKPQSIQAESYRSIRTKLLVSSPSNKVKSILFTSPLAGEGKSSTVSNLGITLALAHFRVVIVDSDLRKPRQHRIFGQDSGPGLSRYLSSDMDLSNLVMPTPIPNLFLINSGPRPANPIELLSYEKMRTLITFLKKSFDYVLFDTPPILAVSDALALSSLADTVILVCRGGQTPIQALKQAKNKLDAHEVKCLGVILNGVDIVEQDGYYARQYYHYSQSD